MKKRKTPYVIAALFASSLIALIALRGDAAEAIVAGAFALIGVALTTISQTGAF